MKPGQRRLGLFVGGTISVFALLIVVGIAQSGGLSRALMNIRYGIAIMRMKGAPSGPPPEVFKQYVLDPLPKSVTELKVHRTHAVFGYGYVFRFKIDLGDLQLILKSRPFEELVEMEYEHASTYLTWKLPKGPTTSMFVYARGQHRPRWFRPDTLKSPKGYAVPDKQGAVGVLIYDAQSEEAYLIVCG